MLEEFVVLDCGVVRVEDVAGLGVDGLGKLGGGERGGLGAVVGLGDEGSAPLGGQVGGGRFGQGEAAWEGMSADEIWCGEAIDTYHAAATAI